MSRPEGARSVRRVPPTVVAATLCLLTFGALWSVVLPLGEGPDEPSHLGLVLHLADGGAYPDHDDLRRTVAVTRLCTTHAAAVRVCPLPGETVTAEATRRRLEGGAPPRDARPDWNDDGGAAPTAAANQMPQHPPLYYVAMASVLRVERAVLGDAPSLDRELALLRLVNVVLVAPLPLLAWLAARRAGADETTAELAAVGVLGLPMLLSTAGVLNNDNLLVLSGACLTMLLAGVATGDHRPRTGVLIGVVTVVGLLTKAFAVVFLPAIVLAYWVGRPRPGDSSSTVAALVRVGAVVVPVAGAWFARTWVRTGSLTPSVDAGRYTEDLRPPGFEPDLVDFSMRFAGLVTERFWGSFGWYTVRIPGPLTVVLTVGGVVLATVGVASVWTGRHRVGRSTLAVLLAPAVLLAVVMAARAWTLHARSGQYPFIQGRYLFAGVVGMALVAALGFHRVVPRREWSVPLASVAVVVLQVYALDRAAAGYWAEPGAGRLERIEAMGAWSGLTAPVVSALVVAAVTGATTVLVVATVTATGVCGRHRTEPPDPGAPVPSGAP